MIVTGLLASLISLSTPSYGDVLYIDLDDPGLRTWHFEAGYTRQLSSQFSDLDGVTLGSSWAAHPNLSLGLFAQKFFSRLNKNGRNFEETLALVDIEFDTRLAQWFVGGLVQLLLLEGRWNLFNWTTLRTHLVLGAGGGRIFWRQSFDDRSSQSWSYVWQAQMRLYPKNSWGFQISALGNSAAGFFTAGPVLKF